MKPLLVYAPAIELGTLSPGSVLPDVPLNLNPAPPSKLGHTIMVEDIMD